MEVLIVGAGKVGVYLAGLLLSGGARVKVVDLHPGEMSRFDGHLEKMEVIEGSGTDPEVLEAAGVRRADVVAAVTGSDEANLVVASLARFEFNVGRVIARVNDPANAWMFTPQMGVNVALNQADILAHLVMEEISVGEMMTLLKLRKGEYSLVEEKVHRKSPAAGTAISELGVPAECVITAVIRKGTLIIPRGDLVLMPEDEVLSVIHSSRIAELAEILGQGEGQKESR
jgi:trk system potassium uptake protein TrkA